MTAHVKLSATIFHWDVNKIEKHINCIARLVFFGVQVNSITVLLLFCTLITGQNNPPADESYI
jgi:hypothetical protein